MLNDAAAIAADFLSLVPAAQQARVEQALTEILAAHEVGAIRNVTFKNLKSVLDSAVDGAWDKAIRVEYIIAGKWEKLPVEVRDLDHTINLHYVRDAIAASKKLAKVKTVHPMVTDMRTFVAKVLPVAIVMEALKGKIVKGRENAIPSGYVRTRENTGTCPCCFRNIKLKMAGIPGTLEMVNHGYERPGIGYIVGNCFGVGFEPFEISTKGTAAFLEKVLRPTLARRQAYLTNLQNGTVVEFTIEVQDREQPRDNMGRRPTKEHTIHKGDAADYKLGIPSFDDKLASETRQTVQTVQTISEDVEAYRKLIAEWKPAPLPETGSLVKDGR